jgi:predicted metal-dependent hydrolase
MDIPSYTVYKSKRKSIKLVLRADGTLAIYCPKRCSREYIEEVIAKHYANLKKHHEARSDALFGESGDTLLLYGKRYPIIYNNVKKLNFDGQSFISPSKDKEIIRKEYRELLRKETRRAVTALINEISGKHGFSYGKISIKSTYSRFGSCSSKKNLNFSLSLAAFDADFIRFVVSHELCHTVHLNHGKDFYALLDKVCPMHRKIKSDGAKERSEILKSIFFEPIS